MQKNVSGQKIGCQMVSATDGSAFTGAVTVYVTGDAGTQAAGSVGAGACTHEGNGYHTYAPAQAETNYDLIAFTFTGSGAVPATVQVYTRWDANLTHSAGTAVTSSGGRPEVNTTHWGGTAVGSTEVRANLINIAGSAVSTSTAQLGVNVVNFGGSAGTFASGRPEVNTTHIAGTAWASTTLYTLASHDPGATIGTSTLTQAQVTGGAYALNSASFAFNAALDFTTTQKAATIARVTLCDTITTYTGDTPQTGDSFARIGATGSGLTSLAPASTALSSATWTGTRAGYLDNLSGGAVALASGVAVSSLAANTITAASIAADTGLKSVRSNTAQTGASTSITLDASASSTGGIYVSQVIHLTGGTGAGQTRLITAYNGTTKVATVSRDWTTTPDNTTTFAVLPVTGFVDVWSIRADATKADYLSLMIGDGTFTADMTACNFPDVTVSALSLTSIGGAVWTSGTRTLTALDEDSTTLDLDATIRAAVGLASANLDTQLDALPTAVENADALLGRNVAGGSSTGRTVSTALYVLRNKVAISGGTMTVYQTDDTTSSWTATLTSDAAAEPITVVDPG